MSESSPGELRAGRGPWKVSPKICPTWLLKTVKVLVPAPSRVRRILVESVVKLQHSPVQFQSELDHELVGFRKSKFGFEGTRYPFPRAERRETCGLVLSVDWLRSPSRRVELA